MKKVFVLIALTAICQLGFSQQNPPVQNGDIKDNRFEHKRHHRKMHDHKKLMNSLNLSDEQKYKIKEMRMATKEKKDAILNSNSLTETQKREQLKDLHKENAKSLEGLLTEDQKTRIKAMKEQRKNDKKFRDAKLKKPEKAEQVIDNANQ